eukprot:TRINITY_DN496_c0_g1_i13.p1 TRINITY_DN496_c0_g1~~TRINITY_DN496_c0_g1_i13.p1  ORF type:complete len:328 (+),score=57.41 TRINITY_DN496_c0_g1_i13:209-1192(+)
MAIRLTRWGSTSSRTRPRVMTSPCSTRSGTSAVGTGCADGEARICLHHSSVPYQPATPVSRDTTTGLMTENDIHEAQKAWGNAIKAITKAHQDKQDFVGVAAKAAGELYAYGHGNVLFKPTKATRNPFRPTAEDAMSYFVGAEAMKDDKFKGEDAGFAINGGRGWSEVVFRNHMIDVRSATAHAMGEYIFTDSVTGDDVTVQYTFGYKRCGDGQVRICLHHSSVPYQAAAPASVKVVPPTKPTGHLTETDVHEAQKAWGNAIKAITKAHQQKQDFVATAAQAAGELYAYGHGDVLFKPTKSSRRRQRRTRSAQLLKTPCRTSSALRR